MASPMRASDWAKVRAANTQYVIDRPDEFPEIARAAEDVATFICAHSLACRAMAVYYAEQRMLNAPPAEKSAFAAAIVDAQHKLREICEVRARDGSYPEDSLNA